VNKNDIQARLVAAVESVGDQRAAAIKGEPINQRAYAAAIALAATVANEEALGNLRQLVPASRATLDDVNLLGLYLAELLNENQLAKATKADLPPRNIALYTTIYHAPYSDGTRWVIQSEERTADARAQAEKDGQWVETWQAHGERRLDKVRRLQGLDYSALLEEIVR
jgi:hypothetical protein